MHKRAIAMAAASATAVGMLAAMTPATAAPKEGATKPYVVLMADMPALGYDGGVKGIPATKPAKGKKINPKAKNVKAYVSHLEKEQNEVLTKAGIEAQPVNQLTYAANGFAVMLTEDQADQLRFNRDVLSVMEDELKQKQTDVSPEFLGLSTEGGAWLEGATGEGVVVGVIDTGIWPEHPSFADPDDLPEHDVKLPCEFGNTEYNKDDAPFKCQNKLIGAREVLDTYHLAVSLGIVPPEVYGSARDSDGHGTHTASTAAGNRDVPAEIFGIDRGTVSGIAPDAGIIAYKGLGDGGGFTSDLAKSIDLAVADGVDVINYSIGSDTPGIGGADDIAFLFAANAGVFVATSTGNAGPSASTTGSPANVPWLTAVGASTTPRTFQATATLGNEASYTGASITEGLDGEAQLVDSATLGNELCQPNMAFNASIEGKVVLCARGVIARVDKSEAVWKYGGVGMILYNEFDSQALVTDNHFVPSLHITNTDGLAIKDYIAAAGADATAMLSQGEKVAAQANVMADFSSRGPVGAPGDPNIIRPDVTAPGVNILAGNTPTPTSGRPGQLFQSISGTSMSSPHVAGLFALLKQAHPDWSPAVAKSALMTTARQDVVKEDGKTPADPFDFGAGHVDPGSPSEKNSMFDPGIAFDADINDYFAYLCGSYSGLFGDPDAACSPYEAAGYSFDPSDLNVPSIGASSVSGVKVVTRTLTNVSGTRLKVTPVIEQPEGFKVSVNPSALNLKPGQSQTFKVTIRAQKADPGQWGFGSLTWKGNGYEARSPIAVKAALVSAPAEVLNTGEAGQGTFDVQFGYTGPFQVVTYGLANETLVPGTVDQDPDQTFDPADPAGTTAHTFDLSNSQLFRVSLSEEDLSGPPDSDIDLFLFGPDGEFVAQSTSSGTNEFIEVPSPTSGTYTLYVHGWGLQANSVKYSLHTWSLSTEANVGSLKILSVPPRATNGRAATVTYGWSGVTEGTSSLGLIEYRNGDTVLGTTAVQIDN